MRLGTVVADVLQTRGRGLKNAFARRWPHPVVVFESDDWGSERMRSRAARDALIRRGALPPQSDYHVDALETADDLGALAEVLRRVRGADGRPAAFTAFVNPANPDFDAIAANGYARYVPEPLTRTLERRGDAQSVMGLWAALQAEGLLTPEYHGREHLQVPMWMEWLRHDPVVRMGFEHGVYSVSGRALPTLARQFRPACFFRSQPDKAAIGEALLDGAHLFERVFGRVATCFCPPNNVFHPELIRWLQRAGIVGLVRGLRGAEPDGRGGGRVVWRLRRSAYHPLAAWSRNAVFEPAAGIGVDSCLRQVASAMRWGVPAIIATHRVNYVGSIDEANRTRGLAALEELLRRIVREWPSVRFLSSQTLLPSELKACPLAAPAA